MLSSEATCWLIRTCVSIENVTLPRYMESTLSAVLTRLCKSDSAINCSIVLIHAFCQFSVY